MLKYLFIPIVILIAGCSANKKAAEQNPPPNWVEKKPVIQGVYTGVGSALKVGPRESFINKAREDALANLAEEIAVNISTTSVLHTLDSQYGNSQTFDQTIKISAVEQLEGHDPVASWENETYYWTFYKIEKSVYAANKAAKKEDALKQAVNKFEAGETERNNNKIASAIIFYLQGLETLKPYLSESCEVQIGTSPMDIGNELLAAMYGAIDNTTINTNNNARTIDRDNAGQESFVFTVRYKESPQKGIPVKFSLSRGFLTTEKKQTDAEGKAVLSNEKFTGMDNNQVLKASIDLQALGRQAVNDLFIRSLLENKKVAPAEVKIHLNNPKVKLEITGIDCPSAVCNSLSGIFLEVGKNRGFEVDAKNYDYLFDLKIEINTVVLKGNLIEASVSGKLQVFDNNNKNLFTKSFELDEAGLGRTREYAVSNALDEFKKNFELIYLNQAFSMVK